MTTKQCRKCDETKPVTEYYKSQGGRLGCSPYCIPCHRAYNREASRKRYVPRRSQRTKRPAELQARYDRVRRARDTYMQRATNPVADTITYDDIVGRHGTGCASVGCAGEFDQLDHVLPVALGGHHTLDNLQPLCNTCHIVKTIEDNARIQLSRVDVLTFLAEGSLSAPAPGCTFHSRSGTPKCGDMIQTQVHRRTP